MPLGDPWSLPPRAPANPRLLKALASTAEPLPNPSGHKPADKPTGNAVAPTDKSQAATDKPNPTGEAANRQAIYDALLHANLLMPVEQDAKPARFILADDDRGSPTVIAFTDVQALQRWQPGSTSFLALPLLQMLRESFPHLATGLWLNVADRANCFLSRAELARITGGLIAPTYLRQVELDLAPLHEDFNVESPGPVTAQLSSRIRNAIASEPEVASAYLFQLRYRDGTRRLALGVRLLRLLDESLVDRMLHRIARHINLPGTPRPHLDAIVLNFDRYQAVRQVVPPIHERGG